MPRIFSVALLGCAHAERAPLEVTQGWEILRRICDIPGSATIPAADRGGRRGQLRSHAFALTFFYILHFHLFYFSSIGCFQYNDAISESAMDLLAFPKSPLQRIRRVDQNTGLDIKAQKQLRNLSGEFLFLAQFRFRLGGIVCV